MGSVAPLEAPVHVQIQAVSPTWYITRSPKIVCFGEDQAETVIRHSGHIRKQAYTSGADPSKVKIMVMPI